MPTPNQNSTVGEMKAYIRSKKLNHPLVRLGLKKADLIKGLKKLGHWSEAEKVKKTRAPAKKKVKTVKPSESKLLQQKGPGSGGKITNKPALNTKKITKKAKPAPKTSVTFKGKKFSVAPSGSSLPGAKKTSLYVEVMNKDYKMKQDEIGDFLEANGWRMWKTISTPTETGYRYIKQGTTVPSYSEYPKLRFGTYTRKKNREIGGMKPAKKAEPKKKVEPKMVVVKVRNYGRDINKSDLNGFRQLSQKEVFGAKAKKQPGNLGNEYYLAEVSSQSDKDKLRELSEGYPSEVDFFSISSINKKFGLMGESNISHSKIRSGDY